MSLLESLKSKLGDCVVARCSPKQGCSLNLRGIPQRVIVDCDKYQQQGRNRQLQNCKICDYIIICELPQTSVSVIEMKSGGVKASDVKEQLSGGAGLAEQWLAGNPIDDFLPVLLLKGGSGQELRVLKKQKVSFRGRAYPIKAERCGAVLSDMIAG